MAGSIVGLDLRGEKEMIKALKMLPGSINRRVIAKATRRAMKPVIKAARANLNKSKRTGQLRKSIGARTVKIEDGIVWTGVGVRKGFDIQTEEFGNINPRLYAHLVEKGFQHRNGTTVPARPFLRPAWDNNRSRVGSILIGEVKVGLAKETERARRKAGGPR